MAYFALLLSIFVHELGHLAFGLFNKVRPESLIFGFIKLSWENQLKIRLNTQWGFLVDYLDISQLRLIIRKF
ncbi:CylI [Enterococcus faecalis]|uniref:CylI n=1 Tax=Enterococcus faecalis TaxID=1351 RepID=A0A8B3RRX0_ENTFL|nr:CylI [Enterococcus faecalis]EGO8544722.1 CylI [Enterococcus faecalis]EGO8660425.1 CylI [Enterococcus faecalis]EGO8682458.1 CylI [Enterococcus faecalis]EGO8720578.1 CylI [Enterococcus faecalis]